MTVVDVGRRLSAAYGWSALGVVALASLFNAQEVVITKPVGLTSWLVGAAPAVVVGLVLLPFASGRRALWQNTWWALAAFAASIVWAAIRMPRVTRCLDQRDGEAVAVCFPDWVSWVPLVQAGFTVLLAWLFVASISMKRLGLWLAGLSAVLVTMSAVALVRALLHPRGFNRLGSGLGGAAVLAVALVIATAVLIGAFMENRARWPAAVGATVGSLLIVATFSRAGLAVAALTICAALWARRGHGIRLGRMGLIGVTVVLVAAVVTVVRFPALAARMLSLGDPGRAENTATALSYWAADPWRVIFGAGTGRLWPWFGVDADLVWAPATGMVGVQGIDGELLVNPHSSFLGVLVEGGLVGLVPLVALLGGVVLAAVRSRGSGPRTLALLAAGASVFAFFLDYYLFRNPGVSFVWWCAVFAGLGLRRDSPTTAPGLNGARLANGDDRG